MLVFVMSEINVLYCFDTNFWQMAAISINTLMEQHRDTNTSVNVYCMVAPHTRGHRKIKKIVVGQGGKLIWRKISKTQNPYNTLDYARWSPVIFYRLFAHEIFPELDKVLYLDADTLIQSNLTELYNTNISKHAFAAVRDMALISKPDDKNGQYVSEFKKNYQRHNLYINSGVLLLNLNYLRTIQSPWSFDCPLKYPDQDILNYVFDGKILELPLRYNCSPYVEPDKKFKLSERKFVKDTIHIVHFYATCKPYYYHYMYRETYSMFARAAAKINIYPEDLIKQELKAKKRKIKQQRTDNTTNIPFLRFDRRGNLRFFGIKV